MILRLQSIQVELSINKTTYDVYPPELPAGEARW